MKLTESHIFFHGRCIIKLILLLWPALFLGFTSCSRPTPSSNTASNKLFDSDEFKSYWYSGKAEINSYALEQSRYGEPRDGSAVLIFVTEDFSRKKQVKLDGSSAADDKVTVMKVNFMKNFVTGIYPYSMMLSVFKPVNGNEYPHAWKVTMSSQEWCGQVFSQMNLQGDHYAFTGHSYFEKEGEEDFEMEATWLEDELWNQIRLDPSSLPTGELKIIPGLFFIRLRHHELKPLRASISSTQLEDQVSYSIDYAGQGRKLTIFYQKKFPHQILGWEEVFVERGETLRTKAVLKKSLKLDYWTKNKNEFQYLRDSLGLSRHNF